MPGTTTIIVPSQEEIDEINGYFVNEWRGHKNYNCNLCQYSTLWIQKMQKHIEEGDHPWAYPSAQQNETAVSDEPEY